MLCELSDASQKTTLRSDRHLERQRLALQPGADLHWGR